MLGRTASAPPPPEPERSWILSDIFNACLTEEDVAESILMDAQYKVDVDREEAGEEQQHVADP
jgi:hypothetical protein